MLTANTKIDWTTLLSKPIDASHMGLMSGQVNEFPNKGALVIAARFDPNAVVNQGVDIAGLK